MIRGKVENCTQPQFSLGRFFFNLAERYHDRICQVDGDTNEKETYLSVKMRSTRLALSLQKRGITMEDTVLICANSTMDHMIPMLASFYLGAKVVNVDPKISARDVSHVVNLVSPTIIFVEESARHLIVECLVELQPKQIIVFGKSQNHESFTDLIVWDSDEDTFQPVAVDLDEIAVIVCTCGTTGLPKAVCHSHRSFVKMLKMLQPVSEKCVVLQYVTSGIGAMVTMAAIFEKGGTKVFSNRDQGDVTEALVARYNVTLAVLSPIQAYKLGTTKYDISCLSFIYIAGTSASVELWKRLGSLFPNVTLAMCYMLSEVGPVSIFSSRASDDSILVPSGMLLPGVMVKIVDPATEEILGAGHKGEIYVKTTTTMRRYCQHDSSKCFDRDGFYKTGDLGYYDDKNCLFVLGRLNDVIKVRSGWVFPALLEAVLLEHRAVKLSAVFGICRDGQMVPTACVVLKDGFVVDKKEIEQFVNERVSDGETLSGGITFVKSVPLTPLGTVVKHNIAHLYHQLSMS